jgi:peptidyl-prolyl cis-trans isomerase SurA
MVVLCAFSAVAQEIIKDTVKPVSVVPSMRQKVDGVIATIGDYNILDSDIDKAFLEMTSQGNSIKDFSRCQMMGKLMEEKLYAHQAIQDSIVVTDEEVKSKMEEQLSYMIEQLGSMDKVIKYFKKSTEEDFRTDLFEIIKMNKLTSAMQKKIVDEVEITPEEVRTFFKKIPEADLPFFGAELEVSQIVVQPKVSDADKQKVIDRLKEFKSEVLAGSSFSTKAVLYSQDPGSSSSGGYYKMNKKTPFVKEFKDVAFSLGEGEISDPFETDFGFHIIYVEKIRGQEVELRHILDGFDYRNLDAEPVFAGQNSTTEHLCLHIHRCLSAALADGKLGAGGQAVTGLKVLLRESHIAWAAYEAAPGEEPAA